MSQQLTCLGYGSMGLDASVACNCYRDGETLPPPHAEHVILKDGFPTLSLSLDGHDAEHAAFEAWRDDACPHPGMEFVRERITSWPGYEIFMAILEEVGIEGYPAIKHEFSESETGRTTAENARRFLAELRRLASLLENGTKAILADADTGEVLASNIGRNSRCFSHRAHFECALGSEGFIVRKREPGEDPGPALFRSYRFEQRMLIDPTAGKAMPERAGLWRRWLAAISGRASGPMPVAELLDLEANHRFQSPVEISTIPPGTTAALMAHGTQSTARFPRVLEVRIGPASPGDLEYIFSPLVSVCEASIQTGNPICWSY